jgi:tetratricopeptide (TPR) repeat protein
MFWFIWQNGLDKNFDEAYRIIDNLVSGYPDHVISRFGQFLKYSWQKEKQKALSIVNSKLEKATWWDDGYSMMMADCYSVLEEYDEAFHWLNRAIDYGITNIPFLTQYDHFLENLRGDERFEGCIQKARKILDSFKE